MHECTRGDKFDNIAENISTINKNMSEMNNKLDTLIKYKNQLWGAGIFIGKTMLLFSFAGTILLLIEKVRSML